MGKYANLYDDIYSIFAAGSWTSENIKTFPSNFVGTNVGNTYIRVSILASGELDNVNPPRSTSGQLIIDIFIPAGEGQKGLATIADKLDTYLAGSLIKTTNGGSTQMCSSTLVPLGNDKDNPGLYRGQYSISFNFFGK